MNPMNWEYCGLSAKCLVNDSTGLHKFIPNIGISGVTIDFSHVYVFGDDVDGPTSTAIVVGPKAVLGCAHSLGTIYISTDNSDLENEKFIHKYNENYWIQRKVRKNAQIWILEDRIPIKLFNYNIENDWAIFVRSD